MEMMNAIVMTKAGGPEVLSYDRIPRPEFTQEHDVLVRLKACGVNPIDTKLRSRGTYYPEQMPAILGCDGAGVIEAVGEAVERFDVGDEVYFCNGGIGGQQGNYAQYTVVNEYHMAQKPESLSFVEAAAVPLVLITAWESLYDRGNLRADDEVLIHAGAGGVGHMAVQLARIAGARVCTTIGSEAKAKFVTDLGADLAIEYKNHDFVSAVKDWSKGGGARLALDTIGGRTFARTFEAMRCYGDIVTLIQPDTDVDWKPARLKNLRFALELMLSPMLFNLETARRHQVGILEQCEHLFDAGELKVHIANVFPLAAAAEAQQLLEKGTMQGKVVLEVD
jgi:NADPH2:quinone reductase